MADLDTIPEETEKDLKESEEPEIASAETTSTKPETTPAETPSIDPEIVERAKRIAEAYPDLITFAPGAKAAFEEMTEVLVPTDPTKSVAVKTNEEKIAAISGIGKGIDDSGLKTFANAATKILCIDQKDLPDNSAILNSLIKAFGFLGEEGPKKENPKEDIALSILEAIHKANSSCKENKAAVDAIDSGFKEAFPGLVEEEKAKSLGEAVEITPAPDLALAPSIKRKGGKLTTASSSLTPEEEERLLTPEEQRIRDEEKANKEANRDSAMEIMSDAFKGTAALTLALAVPPPLGVALAIGFLAYTWDMGHKPEEEKPEIFNGPDVQEYAEIWKKFMHPPEREITAQDIKNFNKAPTITGGVASKVIIEAGGNLKEDKEILEAEKIALQASMGSGSEVVDKDNRNTPNRLESESITQEESKEKSITGEAPVLGGGQLVTGGVKEEELEKLMDEHSQENSFAKFVKEKGGELSEEESKGLSGNIASIDDFEEAASESLRFTATVAEAKAATQELAASLEKGPLTSTEGTILPAGKEFQAIVEDNHFGKEAASEKKISDSDSLSRYREYHNRRSGREESHDPSVEEGKEAAARTEKAKAEVEVVAKELSASLKSNASLQKVKTIASTTEIQLGNPGRNNDSGR